MPAIAAVPLLTPNEAGFTVKAPQLETSKEFQGNGDRTLFFLSFLIPTAVPQKDSYHCYLSYLSPSFKNKDYFLARLYMYVISLQFLMVFLLYL